MIRLLYISTRIPSPNQRGDQLRAYFQLKELSKHAEVTLVCLSSKKENQQEIVQLKKMGIAVHCYFLPKWKRLLSMGPCLFSKIPFQVAYFNNHSIRKDLEKTLRSDSFDMIHCHLIRSTFYAENLVASTRSIDYMDAFGFGMQQRYLNATNSFIRFVFKSERDRLIHFETAIFDKFNQHLAISRQDALRIQHPKNKTISCAANGVDFQQFYPKEAEKKYDLVFMGNMNYPPNIAAVTYIVKEILPILRKYLPKVTLLIAGRSATKLIQSYQSDFIDVVQDFDDISDAIASAKVMIAPMIISIGLQNKILQAMAMKIPVITSDSANQAIGAVPNKHLLTANTSEEFAEKTRLLLESPELQKSLSESSFDFVHGVFNWEKCSRPIIDQLT